MLDGPAQVDRNENGIPGGAPTGRIVHLLRRQQSGRLSNPESRSLGASSLAVVITLVKARRSQRSPAHFVKRPCFATGKAAFPADLTGVFQQI
jgi:hypothetical protein